ncbi:hypothetical protein M422DRAFT_161997 [Sphaerobolus stellatus SS14]|nr:hypothetical protein M422DRAFT_161997 [Sphaerobolus stellatus SS14]
MLYVSNYGNSLLRRFWQLGDMTDLNQSVLKLQEAVQLTPDEHPDKPSRLNSLGNSLLTRFEHLGDMTDLNQSVLKLQEAIQLTPDGHPDMPSLWSNLGNSLLTRFEQLGDMIDLNQSVLKFQEAIQLTPDGHMNKPALLNNLGLSLLRQFERLGNMTDLNQSVIRFREAVQLTPDGHTDKPSRLSNLGLSLLRQFEQLGDMNDLNQSVLKKQEAVQLTPDGHPDKPSRLHNLGLALFRRFEQLGDMTDLNQSVLKIEEAVQLTPDGHPDKPSRLTNLGNSLLTRFVQLGDMTDLNQSSVLKFQEAVQLTPDDHPDKPSSLNNLGNSIHTRFQQLGDMNDLTQSVLKFQEAVQLTPDGHPSKPSMLTNLGLSLLTRFEQLGDMTDLNCSILKKQEAVQLTPDGHTEKPSRLNNLGLSLLRRFQRLGNMTDLNQSVLKFQGAVQITPDDHPGKPSLLNNLGRSLLRRFERLGDMNDLNQSSILKFQEAVQLTPDGHPGKPSLLNNLGFSLLTRFQHTQSHEDMVNASSVYSSAAHAEYGTPFARLTAARFWAACLHLSPSSSPSAILAPYHIAIPLLSQMAWLGSSLPDRHHQIMQAGNVVLEAAAAAQKFGDPIQAVEWLEQGRSVIWGQLLQLRTPLDDLDMQEPELSQQLKLNSFQLEMAASTDMQNIMPLKKDMAQHGYELAVERSQLLNKIRMCPGFERFLLPRHITELTPAASYGPIVILNYSLQDNMCYALILHPNVLDNVLPLRLELFPALRAQVLYDRLQKLLHEHGRTISQNGPSESALGQEFKAILADLWERVVKPVLNALAPMNPSAKVKPHLWWCPTGLLSFLPLHAAGLYHNNAPLGSKLSDFVISSYTPTLSALLDRVTSLQPQPQRMPKLLAIAQPSSISQISLPGTLTEIKEIEQAVKGVLTIKTLVEGNATLDKVVEELKTATWVHFACHGVQNPTHPLKSALLLADNDRLTLAKLASLKMPRGSLAFLSACQTAKGDEILSDEAVHLGAGMLVTGFEGVIGTMWSVTDRVAPQVARDVYRYLKESNLDITEAAHALQLAVENVRKDSISEENAWFISWVPFIHIGR